MKDIFNPTVVNIIAFSFIGLWFIYSIFLINKAKKDYKSVNQYFFNSIPTVFTTIGIFGTFLGIFFGLLKFDEKNVSSSIPNLLEGLKTAFSTSIVGLLLSFIFSRIVSKINKECEPEIITTELATLNAIKTEVSELKQEFANSNKLIISTLNSNNLQIISFWEKVNLKNEIGNQEIINSLNNLNNTNIETNTNLLNVVTKIESLNENIVNQNKNYSTQTTNLTKTVEQLIKLINDNNLNLITKINEFAILLKDANAKALVDAMKQASEEFNKQMKNLLDKLVQENFAKLNESVEKLNSWQKQNIENIQKFTIQFQQVTDNFTISSQKVKEISENTTKLTNDNSILIKLIKELETVLIEENQFAEIIEQLQTATHEYRDSTQILNKFLPQIPLLIKQIEELKNTESQLWTQIRQNLHNAAQTLNTTITTRDGQYERWLTQTLTNLDNVMRRHIENRK